MKTILLADLVNTVLSAVLYGALLVGVWLWRRRQKTIKPAFVDNTCKHCLRCHTVRLPRRGICITTGYCNACSRELHK
jgi:hypothetical protein